MTCPSEPSAADLRAIIDQIADFVFVLDADGLIAHVNRVVVDRLGFEPAELYGQTVLAVHPPDRHDEALRIVGEMLEGKRETCPVPLRAKDGTLIPVETRVTPGHWRGRPALFGICRDVSERQRDQDALRFSEARLRALSDASFEAIFLSERGVCQDQNLTAQEMFGYTREEAIGRMGTEWIAPEDRPLVMEKMMAGVESTYEVTALRKDGSTFPCEIQGRMFEHVGRPVRVTSLRDITETSRLRTLAARAQRLEIAGRIAGQVAHDFNNMLGPLTAYPDLIRDDLPADHPAHPLLDDMELSARRMAEINQQLLTLGRQGYYEKVSCDLNQLVEQVVRSLRVPTSTAVCETDLDPRLLPIHAGPAQLSRAVLNLVQNGIDAIEGVGVVRITTDNVYLDEPLVRYGQVPQGEYVRLSVSDTGTGIPEDVLQRAFEPFFTTKTVTRTRGSGLGLSVVESVIDDHDGYIDVESSVGQGSTFHLYLPICRAPASETPKGEASGGDERILVVDDDAIQRDVTTRLLRKLGYSAEAVKSGEEALGRLAEEPWDLLLLDMVMPGGIDGTETYRRALALEPLQRAVILSGYAESERAREALSMGAGSFLRKPVSIKGLASAVREALDRPGR